MFIQKTLICTLLAIMLLVLTQQLTNAAVSSDSDVQITVDEVLLVEYTGNHELEFNLTEEDLFNGSLVLIDQGSTNWWANIAPWKISVERTNWSPPADFILQVKHGSIGQDWCTILTEQTDWLFGDASGSGTFGGVDWKVTNFGTGTVEGMYTSTVTFTIAQNV